MNRKNLTAFPGLYNPEKAFQGLLEEGYFTEKIIPLFSSHQFYEFIKSPDSAAFLSNFKNTKYGFISQRRLSNKSKVRVFSIPHPHVYSLLCYFIKNNWARINALIATRWKGVQYNLASVRRMSNTNKIFDMNYSSRTNISILEHTSLASGSRFVVEADISNFFPSIYTHSIGWSVVGREKAYINKNKKKIWYNKLDELIRNSQNEESHGIQVGPCTSQVIADIILSYVDKKLIDEKFKFRRYIDDYKCYVYSKDEADRFIFLLSGFLNELRLSLNSNKTKVLELPSQTNSLWVRELRNFKFYKRNKKLILLDDGSISEISDFFDLAIYLEKQEHNAAIFNYALKILFGAKITPKASNFIFTKSIQLVTIFPYLADFLPNILTRCNLSVYNDNIEYLITNSLKLSDWASASYAIYSSIISHRFIHNFTNYIDKIIDSKDCILIYVTYIYNERNNISNDKIIDFAKSIVQSKLDDDYWLLIYDLFKSGKLNNIKNSQQFGELKKYNISFLKQANT